MKINIKYLPNRLTRKDRKEQSSMLKKSRKLYKKGKYFTRKHVSSYKSKKSPHIIKAEKIYHLNNIVINKDLEKATGCSQEALSAIVKKGEGAYYSSGSRPNQTPQSWGIARLASSISSGKAAVVDFNILKNGCKLNSKALSLAKKAQIKYKKGTKRVRKVNF